MKEEEKTEHKGLKNEHPIAKFFGVLFTAACAFVIGWIVKGMIPERPMGMPPGMMPPAAVDPLVKVESAEFGILNPPLKFIGHVEPVRDVDLTARISGYVTKVNFVEGSIVKEGELLFEIDPEPYEATVAVRKAEIAQAQAEMERAQSYLNRLNASDARGISQADLDTALSDVAGSKAKIEQTKAVLLLAEIDLKHCRIIAPIDGKIGRTLAHIGDYVAPAAGTLARIVQVDPIRVVFSVTDREYVGIREKIAEDQLDQELRLRIQLPTGTIPEIVGERDFEDNEMSATTATLPVRVKFDNKDGLLIPNSYVTVLVDAQAPAQYPVVSQSALAADKEGDFVYVVGTDEKAHKRRVQIGDVENGRVELHQGVSVGERVVIQGLQGLTDGATVRVFVETPVPKAAEPEAVINEGVALK
ncbi:MAG: efflux RND transporter periplasmic adaptor subunit [Kiritimatiellia bacterium]